MGLMLGFSFFRIRNRILRGVCSYSLDAKARPSEREGNVKGGGVEIGAKGDYPLVVTTPPVWKGPR